jgi:hypothetical protein
VHGKDRTTPTDRIETHRRTPWRTAAAGAKSAAVPVSGASPPGVFKSTLVGKATVPVTGGRETFQDVTAGLSRAHRGTTTLHLVSKGSGTGALFDVDDFTFTTG